MSAETPFSFTTGDEKKSYVRRMFGEISGTYDFFNHFLSFGFDYGWRRRAIEILKSELPNKTSPAILDVACGTGDLAFEALHQIPEAKITGADLTLEMLTLFQKKIERRKVPITLEEGDVENLQFADATFDGVTIGFGTRNFTDLAKAFSEIHRVLKPGGVFINLELAKPRTAPMRELYALYFNGILPATASVLSRHDSAYRYLPDSLRKFPDLEPLAEIMYGAGFDKVRWETLTGGIVAIHVATKSAG